MSDSKRADDPLVIAAAELKHAYYVYQHAVEERDTTQAALDACQRAVSDAESRLATARAALKRAATADDVWRVLA